MNFTPEALAGIFLGKITKWNDPAIASANPGVKLPGDDIVVVHRSDGSGTTYIWTDYLSKVSPEWQTESGQSDVGELAGGLGRQRERRRGRADPADARIRIGYVELIYAIQNKIAYGKVKNASGAFVKADLASVSAAAAAAAKSMPDDFRVSITNPEGNKAAYPISSFTWLLIPSKIQRCHQARCREGFPEVDDDGRTAVLRRRWPTPSCRRKSSPRK